MKTLTSILVLLFSTNVFAISTTDKLSFDETDFYNQSSGTKLISCAIESIAFAGMIFFWKQFFIVGKINIGNFPTPSIAIRSNLSPIFSFLNLSKIFNKYSSHGICKKYLAIN